MFKNLMIAVLSAYSRWRNRNHPERETWMAYPQTWCEAVKPSPALCGFIIGHELSKTESSYAGGPYVTKWCRWCNKAFKVDMRSDRFALEWGSLLKEQVNPHGKDA